MAGIYCNTCKHYSPLEDKEAVGICNNVKTRSYKVHCYFSCECHEPKEEPKMETKYVILYQRRPDGRVVEGWYFKESRNGLVGTEKDLQGARKFDVNSHAIDMALEFPVASRNHLPAQICEVEAVPAQIEWKIVD